MKQPSPLPISLAAVVVADSRLTTQRRAITSDLNAKQRQLRDAIEQLARRDVAQGTLPLDGDADTASPELRELVADLTKPSA